MKLAVGLSLVIPLVGALALDSPASVASSRADARAGDYVLDVVSGAGGESARIGPWIIPPATTATPRPPGGSLGAAMETLGKPARCVPTPGASGARFVDAEWSRPRMAASFYTLGGGKPIGCRRGSVLALGTATCFDTRCVTTRGLRVGSSLGALRRLYPGARPHGAENNPGLSLGRDFWLKPSRCGPDNAFPCSLLTARVVGDAVVWIQMPLGLGGE